MLKKINHKNIIKIYDTYTTKDKKNLWIIYEYCQYGSIAEILQNTGLIFSEGYHIFYIY